MPIVLKSGSLNFLEPSGPVQAYNGIALPLAEFSICVLYLYPLRILQAFLFFQPNSVNNLNNPMAFLAIFFLRAAITKLNGILWDRDVTPKTKTHVYHAVVKKVQLNNAAETWCLKAKTVSKLNSTEMDFWRRSDRISRKDKRNAVRSLLGDINALNAQLNPICHLLALLGAHHIFHVSGLRVKNQTTSMVWICSKNGREQITKKKL